MKEEEIKDLSEIEENAQRLLEEKDADMRLRSYDGFFNKGIMVLLAAWTIFQLYFNTIGVMDAITLRADRKSVV